MFKLLVILSSVAGLAMAVAAPRALASAQTGQKGSQASTTYTTSQKTVSLSPITVYGQHLPLPLVLQLYKKALTRTWSGNPADRHKLVCRWHSKLGTHTQTLFCQTNAQHEKLASATQIGMNNGQEAQTKSGAAGQQSGWSGGAAGMGALNQALAQGEIPVVLAYHTTRRPIQRGPMAALLAELPPANASYTLRVTGKDGRPVLDYVIKHGELVRVYHYVYKNGKAGKAKH